MTGTEEKTRRFIVLPLRELVVFPYMVVPLFVGRERSLKAVNKAHESSRQILVVTQKNPSVEDPGPGDLFDVGTVAQILQVIQLPDGIVKVLVEGSFRARITEFISSGESLEVIAEEIPDDDERSPNTQALMRNVLALFEQYVKVSKKVPSEVLVVASSVETSGRLADVISANLNLKLDEKQEILAALTAEERLEHLTDFIQREIDILDVDKKITERVRKQMEQLQKEYFLREQMKAIQRELGDQDEIQAEVEEFKKKIADANMPEHARDKALQELGRLAKVGYNSAESGVIRSYLDVLVELPWSRSSADNLDVKRAAKILDRDHFALKDPKERILEFLSVMRLRKNMKGPILCFMGPPGVGKTSLARSIAEAMGREFIRVSLGGIRDEAEIRGHRKTYVGAMPGRIIQLIRRAKTNNPVFLLDEVDKTGSDWRGDISSALLEVLDPEQNNNFQDHYLGIPFDLSKVLFIATANVPHTIPEPLRDRMEVIHLPGYTEFEKLVIARRYLVPKQAGENGLRVGQIHMVDRTIQKIIREYTREAGIRELERRIGKVLRKVARDLVSRNDRRASVRITESVLEKHLGIAEYTGDEAGERDQVGVATGLAWTPYGGQILPIECLIMRGTGKVQVTGQLGDVMKESVRAAITHVRANSLLLGVREDFHHRYDVHVHSPGGAGPKDGPAAGITIATAVVSALSRRPVRHDLAMAGELTLAGKVLPVEGVKEKSLAAFRVGIKEVIVSRENQKDLSELPDEIRKGIKFTPVESFNEVLEIALLPKPPSRAVTPLPAATA